MSGTVTLPAPFAGAATDTNPGSHAVLREALGGFIRHQGVEQVGQLNAMAHNLVGGPVLEPVPHKKTVLGVENSVLIS